MEKNLSISSVPGFITGSIKTSSGSYLIVGDRFIGKRELLDIVGRDLKRSGITVISENMTSYGEFYRYQAVNDLLNQATGTEKNRDKKEIIEDYNEFLSGLKKKTVFIVNDIDKINNESRNMLLYICRVSSGRDISFIGTFSFDRSEMSYNKFIEFISSENYMNVIKLERPKDEDIAYIIREMGYKLPDNFLKELNRLTNSNIENIKYALRYYQTIGVIDQKKEVNEISFRYFPVPPTTEMYFDSITSSLEKKQKTILYILSIVGGELKEDVLGSIMGAKPESIFKSCSKLIDSGLLNVSGDSFSINGEKIKKIILKNASGNDILNAYNRIVRSTYFPKMPIPQRLNTLLFLKKYDDIKKILESERENVIKSFSSLDDLTEILEKTINDGKIQSDSAYYLLCRSYYLKGEMKNAMECYESHDFSNIDCERTIMDRFNIYRTLGYKEKALDLLDYASSKFDDERLRIRINYEKTAFKYYYERSNIKVEEIQNVMDQAKKMHYDDIYAKSLTLLGNLELSIFNYEKAMSAYKEAVSIDQKIMEYSDVSKNLNNMTLIHVYTGKYDMAISILKELIESTYTTGDLIARIYALYNLSEIYYVIGHQRYAESYIPLMLKLLDVTGDKTVAFYIHRFMILYKSGLFDLKKAIEYASLAEEEAPDEKKREMVHGLGEIMKYFEYGSSESIDNIVFGDGLFDDDYASFFYIYSAYYYLFNDEKENAMRAIELAKKAAAQMNISYNIVNTEMHNAILLLAENRIDDFAKNFISLTPPGTGLKYYDETYDIFRAIYQDDSDALINSKYRIIEEDYPRGSLKDLIPILLNAYALMKIAGKKEDFQHILNIIPLEFSGMLKKLSNYA